MGRGLPLPLGIYVRFCLTDFETASSCDLKKAGAWRYGEDITTEVICLGWTDGTAFCVLPPEELGFSPDSALARFVADPDCMFVAHNVAFEKSIWRNVMMPVYGWPDIPNDRWHDIMAVCAMKAIPLKLERAAKALGLAMQKDMEGSRVTLSLSRPDKKGKLNRDDDTLRRVYQYNRSDLVAEVELHRRVRGLGDAERRVWLFDQGVNERGVRLDVEFIKKAQQIVDQATVPLLAEFKSITGLNPGQRDKVLDWLHENDCDIPDLQKATIAEYLGAQETDESQAGDAEDFARSESPDRVRLAPSVERCLHVRQILGSGSVKKLGAMRSCVCGDGRARGLLQYHGSSTGRWAGRLLQPQNFPRPSLKVDGQPPDQDNVIAAIMSGDAEYVRMFYGEPLEVVSSALRHVIIADPGKSLAVGDFKTIEARIVLALAGQMDQVAIMADGGTPYIPMAQAIYKRPIDKERDLKEYTIGKNTVLGCGFQMGWRKFQARYAPRESDEFCKEVVRVYRQEKCPMVPKLWAGLEAAACNAVWSGHPQEAYGVEYRLEDGWLTARLPSGRKLYYFDPRQERKEMPWDKTDVRPGWTYRAQKLGKWVTVSAYGGLLTENVVQALARDLLVNAMFNCEANNYPVILTVHDEVVCEVAGADKNVLDTLLCDRPQWARELQIPLAADCWTGDRYRK